jgi:CPA2 family monovalent cation:H+ antiporter-2
MAGLLITRSAYSHQALGEVLPLREVFNALFFVSIGMLFDVHAVLEAPALVLTAIVGVVVLKFLVAGGVTFALGHSVRVAVLAGLALAQIGEFSFVLSRAGAASGLLDDRLEQLFIAVAVGTMALTPALAGVAPRAADWLVARLPERVAAGRAMEQARDAAFGLLEDHVVIVGFGLNGRNLARVLSGAGIPFIVIEMNPDTVRVEREKGTPILFGDATRPEIFGYAGVARARVVVVAISDAAATRSAAVLARRLNPGAHILVRSRYVHEIDPLRALGTDEVVPEEYETSIEIFSRVLRQYLVPSDEIARLTREIRGTGYEALRAPGELPAPPAGYEHLVSGLAAELGRVEAGSQLAGRSLREGELRQRTGVSIVGIRRADGSTLANPSGDDVVEAGDVVLLLGEPAQIAAALPLLRAAARPPGDATLASATGSA